MRWCVRSQHLGVLKQLYWGPPVGGSYPLTMAKVRRDVGFLGYLWFVDDPVVTVSGRRKSNTVFGQ